MVTGREAGATRGCGAEDDDEDGNTRPKRTGSIGLEVNGGFEAPNGTMKGNGAGAGTLNGIGGGAVGCEMRNVLMLVPMLALMACFACTEKVRDVPPGFGGGGGCRRCTRRMAEAGRLLQVSGLGALSSLPFSALEFGFLAAAAFISSKDVDGERFVDMSHHKLKMHRV